MPAITEPPATPRPSADPAPAASAFGGPPLAYEQEVPWYAQQRAFRLIVLLLLLNIVAVTSITWAPLSVRAWESHRAARQAEAAQAQQAAAASQAAAAKASAVQATVAVRSGQLTQCLAFPMPAGKVAYTEDPAEAARLLADGRAGYAAVPQVQAPSYPDLVLPHPPVLWAGSPELRGAIAAVGPAAAASVGALFLHERKTPGGVTRLVWVDMSATRTVHRSTMGDGTASAVLAAERDLRARVIDPAAPATGDYSRTLWTYSLRVIEPEGRRASVPWERSPAGRQPPPARPGDVLRLMAGRADPADESRFFVDYTFNGQPGTLAFRLLDDDRLRLDADRGLTTVRRFDAALGLAGWDPLGEPAGKR